MIIYDAYVNDFLELAKNRERLISTIKINLLEKFGIRVADNEMNSWGNSLPEVAKLIKTSDNDFRKVLIEYNIPTSRNRIDFIILGKDKNNKPSAWVVELKQWSNVSEEEWNRFKVGKYSDSHPSGQAKDYVFRLNEMLGLKDKVNIKGSAFLHNLENTDSPLFSESYERMLGSAKLYSLDLSKDFANDMNNHTFIKNGDEAFEYFKTARWSPTKTFQNIVSNDLNSAELQLIGTQKIIYEQILRHLKSWNKKDKMTFIVSGDPGSGKTIISFKLMTYIVSSLMINIQLMIPGQEVRDAFSHRFRDLALSNHISGSTMKNGYDAAIIDEAHKAIGWDWGHVNYQRMYESLNFAIILIDNDQVINSRGLEKQSVIEIAEKNGHEVFEYQIEESFRNGGERMLLDWISSNLYGRTIRSGDNEYKHEVYINENSNFKLHGYKDDDSFVKSYYKTFKNNKNTRLTSLWHQSWYYGEADENGDVPTTVNIGNHKMVWNPNKEWWDKLTSQQKSTYNNSVKKYVSLRRQFLIDIPNPKYIAYFNHIQGYEFENIFVYIPNIFTYENDEIVFHRDRIEKEVKSSQTWSPNTKSELAVGKDIYQLNKKYFLNRIKVMMTRGTKSTHIYAEDKALNDFLRSKIK